MTAVRQTLRNLIGRKNFKTPRTERLDRACYNHFNLTFALSGIYLIVNPR